MGNAALFRHLRAQRALAGCRQFDSRGVAVSDALAATLARVRPESNLLNTLFHILLCHISRRHKSIGAANAFTKLRYEAIAPAAHPTRGTKMILLMMFGVVVMATLVADTLVHSHQSQAQRRRNYDRLAAQHPAASQWTTQIHKALA